MTLLGPFIRRPVATTLLTVDRARGGIAYKLPGLPASSVEFPTINFLRGSCRVRPGDVAYLRRDTSRAAVRPDRRSDGMTSSSSSGLDEHHLQFDLNRNIDARAGTFRRPSTPRAASLPANLPNHPNYRKVNPADAPILLLSLTSDVYGRARMYDVASSIPSAEALAVRGVGAVRGRGVGALPARCAWN